MFCDTFIHIYFIVYVLFKCFTPFLKTLSIHVCATICKTGAMWASPDENVVLITYICAMTHDFQQVGVLTSVCSDEPVQPPFKLRNSKCHSVSGLTIIEYSSD